MGSLINSSFSIDENTRLLYYHYQNEERYISNQQLTAVSSIQKSMPDVTATHIVTKVKSGIEALIVLQLFPGDQTDPDCLLTKISEELPIKKIEFTKVERLLLEKIISTTVFSNIPDLMKLTTLIDICDKINSIKRLTFNHCPLKYALRPIKWFYPSYPPRKAAYIPLEPEIIKTIKQYWLPLSSKVKQLQASIDPGVKKLFGKYLRNQFDEVQQDIIEAEELYSVEIERVHDLVLKLRNGTLPQDVIAKMLISESEESLQNKLDFTAKRLQTLIDKAELITEFRDRNVQYLNMEEYLIQSEDNLKKILQKLLKKNKPMFVLCSTDDLRKRNLRKWKDFVKKLLNEREENSLSDLVYADLSYSSCHFSDMTILSLKPLNDIEGQPESPSLLKSSTPETISPLTKKPRTTEELCPSSSFWTLSSRKNALSSTGQFKLPVSSRSLVVSYTNVLLLGESDVDKSTFINSLVNYLTFETLQQARSGKPFAVIPVSFLMTVGDNFDERIVRFGNEDSNEDHDHPGQSVTQHCRSYVFPIGTKTKLRIIDTPGMGDTRGLDQDDLNLQYILSFINNLSHLDAICILLKPNESRLNIVLRSYFTRLLNFLGENARHNIVFCFTNTRATFYAPGNTGPLLKKMIDELSIKGIPFKKSNTFCFDSESFRYLIARENGIEFDDYQKEKNQRSWVSSVKESNRLVEYICGKLKPYSQNEWQSIEHADFTINQMIRPMLETTRNILRNIVLLEENSSRPLIKLHPIALSEPSAICYKCKRTPQQYSEFWILPDNLHYISEKCKDCSCARMKHIDVDYKLEYELSHHEDVEFLETLKLDLDDLKMTILEFAVFYAYIVDTLKQDDPLLSTLKRMVAEEDQIRLEKGKSCLNSTLYVKLVDLKDQYEKRRKDSMSNRQPISLSHIYQTIQNTVNIDEMKEQMKIIKQTQERYIKKHDKEVSFEL